MDATHQKGCLSNLTLPASTVHVFRDADLDTANVMLKAAICHLPPGLIQISPRLIFLQDLVRGFRDFFLGRLPQRSIAAIAQVRFHHRCPWSPTTRLSDIPSEA